MGHAHIVSIRHDGIRDAGHKTSDVQAYQRAIGEAVLDLCVFAESPANYLGGLKETKAKSIFNQGRCIEYVDRVHDTQDRVYVFIGNRLARLAELDDKELEKVIEIIGQEFKRRGTER